jgi:urease accessory protein
MPEHGKTIMKHLIPFVFAFISAAALAHPGHDHSSGLVSGLAHPFMGLDHLLAMLALGVWAAQWRGRLILLAPAVFIAAMLIGAFFALGGGNLPFIEHGIALSVLLIGLLVAVVPAQGAWAQLALPVIAIGAALHGYAHGTELPASAAPHTYLFGFALATGLLHLAGIALGLSLKQRLRWRRIAGFAVAAAGAMLTLTLAL